MFGVAREERVRKRRAKVGSIKPLGSLWDVHFLASCTINLDSILTEFIAEGVRHDLRLVTISSWTIAIGTLQEFSIYDSKA